MMNLNKYVYNYFLILFSFIPVSILLGSAVSLSNIILIDLSILFLLVYRKEFLFLKDKSILYLLLLYIYLIFNSFISVEFSESIKRNFGFIRIILLFIAFNFFFINEQFFKKVLNFWLIIIFIVIIDVYIERYFGSNIFGFDGKEYGSRIVSFFKDEPIVGGYLNSFYLLLAGYLLHKIKKDKFLLIALISLIFILAIMLTGERSNTIKCIIGLTIFLLFIKSINLKKKIILIFMTLTIILFSITNHHYLKQRFFNQIKTSLMTDSVYMTLYRSGYKIFKDNMLFGVGNKNYRVVACDPENKHRYICNSHPHQIYLELLSEHGIFGTAIILIILYKIIFSKIFIIYKKNNYIQIGSFIYLLLVFTPIIPSGAFFNDFLITIFCINLSLLYALNKNLNIFRYKYD